MCGIAGIWGNGRIRKMINSIAHRGPDEQGFFEGNEVQLGISRLAVLDLEKGSQPMFNEAEFLVIVHNGEVYNYKEIRHELIERGYHFRTKTDTEVILNSYQEWGTECLQRFNGMFAFAIWDERNKKLFIARDRVGVKPLYWAHVQNRFWFASEIKAILQEYSSAPELDSTFFSFECPLFEKTLFKDIQTLLPGHYMIYDGKEVDVRQYWRISDNRAQDELRDEEAVEELRWLLRDSVRIRMRSDVPVGLFVSGGLDSAILSGLSGVKFLYTCRYPLGPLYDEFHYVQRLAEFSNLSPVVCITPQPEDLREHLKSIIYFLDCPIATASCLSVFMLAQRAARDVKVVLGGEGADEIFGGYVRYLLMMEESHNARKQFDSYQDLLQYFNGRNSDMSFGRKYFQLMNRGTGDANAYLFDPFFCNNRSRIDQMGLCDMTFVLPSLLTMNDRACAHVGLENRTPFLDYRIVEFAFQIPDRLKTQNGISKNILREVAKKVIPEEIRTRTDKKGLVTPVHRWLNGPLKSWADDLSGKLDRRGVIWPKPPSRGEFDRYLYSRICLELWFQNFFPDFVM